MRILPAFLVFTLSFPAAAATIEARSHVVRVTVFPGWAQVVREVTVDGPAGTNRLVVPDLPAGTDPSTVRVSGNGVLLGAISVAEGRQPATGDLTAPAVTAAKDRVERLMQALAKKQAAVAEIRLQAQATKAEINFLRGLNKRAPAATVDALKAQAQMVNDEVLAAARRGFEAEQKARVAELALKPDKEALARAKKALAALQAGGRHATFSADVAGKGTVEITTYTNRASWRPAYDIRLDRATKTLTIQRGAFVSQNTGEDWTGVDLTLSTARPSDRSVPSVLRPWLVHSGPPVDTAPAPIRPMVGLAAPRAGDALAKKAPEAIARTELVGATVTYHYGQPATIRSGVEQVRLSLDKVTLTPDVYAAAAPALDSTAFLMAKAKNSSGQVLLPGPAVMYSDGAVTGSGHLRLTAAGAELTLGFGPIDGLRLSAETQAKSSGDRGLFSKSNERQETRILKVQNLTKEMWPLQVTGRIPYSEQKDLTVKARLEPKPTETDPDGRRGILIWKTEIGAGQTQKFRIETTLNWPSGQVLR